MSAVLVLATLALLFAAASSVVAGVVAARFARVRRLFVGLHGLASNVFAEVRDYRAELNRTSLRVAELEHRSGIAPKSVHVDMRGARDVGTELERVERVPRLGDQVEALADGGQLDVNVFVGKVTVVDHEGRMVSVTATSGAVRNFKWSELRYVA